MISEKQSETLNELNSDPTEAAGPTPAEEMRQALVNWEGEGAPEWRLVDWLEGYGLPGSSSGDEPYHIICRALGEIGSQNDQESFFCKRIAEFIDNKPDCTSLGYRPQQVLYNLFMLCASLHCPTCLAEPLKRLYKRRVVEGQWRSFELRDALLVALIENQNNEDLLPEWKCLIDNGSHPYLLGDAYDGFAGITKMVFLPDDARNLNLSPLSDGLVGMSRFLETREDRVPRLTELVDGMAELPVALSNPEQVISALAIGLEALPEWAADILAARIGCFPIDVRVGRTVEQWSFAAQPDWNQLREWLQGDGLPTPSGENEPYYWISEGLKSAGRQESTEDKFCERLAEFINQKPEEKPTGRRPQQVLYNLFKLCEWLHCPKSLAGPLLELYRRDSQKPADQQRIVGHWQSFDVRKALMSALIENQDGEELLPVWMEMIDGRNGYFPAGSLDDGFEGVLKHEPAPETSQNVGPVLTALSKMVPHLDRKQPEKREAILSDLLKAVVSRYSSYTDWFRCLVEQAVDDEWPVWAYLCCSRVIDSISYPPQPRESTPKIDPILTNLSRIISYLDREEPEQKELILSHELKTAVRNYSTFRDWFPRLVERGVYDRWPVWAYPCCSGVIHVTPYTSERAAVGTAAYHLNLIEIETRESNHATADAIRSARSELLLGCP